MSLYLTDKEIEKLKKRLGYKGCKNCKNRIEPFKRCEWSEQSGDKSLHLICPKWEKRKE